MVTFIALFFPAVLSVWIWEAASKAHAGNRKCLYLYSLNVMIVNLICFAIKKWIRNTGAYPIGDMTPTGAINYIVVAVIISVVLALAETFIYKRVRIQIEANTKTEEGIEDKNEEDHR